ncbi:hypothetical protein NLJ89_g4870 [Agrocybe chaxingu]|uniref:F-box protein n=1 Tax=Agrocybe chaxingu TaxID=84603 RepID=A0A9W8K943_9AGAR|nr:hypothetical protein NLJ89_g4870 [Agrocybe chaxingu]
MAKQRTSTFSQECLDSIIDMVAPVKVYSEEDASLTAQQTETLRVLSLVSIRCCMQARKHLFSEIRLQLDDESTHLRNLANVLEANKCGVRECPRRIDLKMPQLRKMKLEAAKSSPIVWSNISEAASTALWGMHKTSPLLDDLGLCRFKQMDVDYVRGWSGIQELSLNDCQFAEPSTGEEGMASFPHLQDLHLSSSLAFLRVLAKGYQAPHSPALRCLDVGIRSCYEGDPMWAFLSSSWVQSLEELKIERWCDSVKKPSVEIRLPALTSLDLRIYAVEGDYIEFTEVVAVGATNSSMKTLSVKIKVSLKAREFGDEPEEAWEIGFNWDELDDILAGPTFSSLETVRVHVEFVLHGDDSCGEEECGDLVYEMVEASTGYSQFRQIGVLESKVDFEFDSSVRWEEEEEED